MEKLSDIAIIYRAANKVDFRLRTNGNEFDDLKSETVGTSPVWSVSGDLDGNGSIDLVTANKDGSTISVLFNDGTAEFERYDYYGGNMPQAVSAGDFTGDDVLDVMSIDANGDVLLYQNSSEFPSVHKYTLALTSEHSTPKSGQDWTNAIDNDINGTDGTVSDNSNPPYAVFAFFDNTVKKISQVRLLTDTGIGNESQWVNEFHVDVSTTTMDTDDFVEVFHGVMQEGDGDWQEFKFEAHYAKYVKITVDKPDNGFRQLGEFEVWGTGETLGAPELLNPQNSQHINTFLQPLPNFRSLLSRTYKVHLWRH